MDADRFDAISRALGTETRRRGMLKAAAGGALGVMGLSRLTDSRAGQEELHQRQGLQRQRRLQQEQVRRMQE